MHTPRLRAAITVATLALAPAAMAGFIIEIDTDGMDDGLVAYNPGFGFGGDTTDAPSSFAATAFGTTGGDSIFGGDGINFVDTYVFAYSPVSQTDNLVIPAGTDLGEGNIGTGIVGGGANTYSVYALWPYTENVSGNPVTYDVVAPGDSFQVQINQNFRGDAWVYLGDIAYTTGVITVTQRASQNTFVSMRASGVLFEAVPAPGAAPVFALGALILGGRRRAVRSA